jgi:hypothetical protein
MIKKGLFLMGFLLFSLVALAEPIAKLTPTSLDFKEQAINVVSAERTMTLNNNGQEEVNNLAVTLSGTHKSDFTMVTDCSNTLIVGQSCSIKVTFKPKAEGVREAVLTVKSNAKLLEATLKGSGIIVTPLPTVTPTTVDFGSQSANLNTSNKTVTLKNTGNGELNKITFSVETAKKGEFTASAPDCTVLAPGKSCKVNLTFAPTAGGDRTGTLTIKSNATTPLQVTLKGVGVIEQPQIKLSPTALSFTTQATATTSAEKTITLSNTGKADLKNLSIKLEGTHKAEFKMVSTCTATLAPAANCVVTVTFTPKAEGAREATLTIKSNAAEIPTQVALKGTGKVEKPVVKLSPTSLNFATQATGETSAEKTITLSNAGEADLKNISVRLEGTHKAEFKTVSTCGTTLAPAANCVVTVTFTPKAEGEREATLTIKSNLETPTQVALKGTGKGGTTPENPYPTLGKAFVLEPGGQILPAQAKFSGGIAVKGGKLAKVNKIKWLADETTGQFASEAITLSGLIAPDTENVGQAAELFVVEFIVPADAEGKANGSYDDCGNPEKGSFYMWTAKEPLTLELWNGYPETLLPFSQINALENSSTLEVYQGPLSNPGHHCLYFGYRVPDGKLFFNGEATINFTVSQ